MNLLYYAVYIHSYTADICLFSEMNIFNLEDCSQIS